MNLPLEKARLSYCLRSMVENAVVQGCRPIALNARAIECSL